MTTKVTVTTHNWPVQAVITDRGVPEKRHTMHANDVTTSTQAIGPQSEREFYLTDTRSIEFFELAEAPKAESKPDED